jgi:hypothetical protein
MPEGNLFPEGNCNPDVKTVGLKSANSKMKRISLEA